MIIQLCLRHAECGGKGFDYNIVELGFWVRPAFVCCDALLWIQLSACSTDWQEVFKTRESASCLLLSVVLVSRDLGLFFHNVTAEPETLSVGDSATYL